MTRQTVILLLYFFSGFSALVYEIVWARMLGLAVGTTVVAWAAVLAAYMGGMALGAAFGGRFADRTANPWRLFALCEAGIGIFGAMSPAIMHSAQNLFLFVQPFIGPSEAIQTMTRVVFAGVLLLIPTALMGCTLPAVSRMFFSKGRPFGRDLSVIYSVNTLGAVAGSLAAGFVLLPAIGMSASLCCAAAINGTVAVAAFFIIRSCPTAGPLIEVSDKTAESSLPAWLLPSILGCSGFCALAFEVLWSRGLVFFLSSTTYAFTTVLSIVLLGLAVGGMAAARIGAGNSRRTVAWIAALQLLAGCLGFASPFILQHIDQVIHFAENGIVLAWWQWTAVRYLVCFIIIFPPALCMGATFPLAIGASINSFFTAGRSVGYLSALNTIGGIAGALTAAFLLIPVAGIQRSFVIIAFFNCAAGFAAVRAGIRCSLKTTAAGIAAAAVLLVFSIVVIGRNPMVLYTRVVHRAEHPVAVVSYREDATASVAVLKNDRERLLSIDGFNAAGTYRYEYMHLLAHLPVVLSPSPDTVLVICLGTGTTCGTAGLYPSVKLVECVEISRAVIASAPYFSDVNHSAADNPKIRIIHDDGRNHLLRSRRHYDVITLEPMHPYLASATNLYSADFYRLCRERLSTHGVMAQWAPMHMLSPAEYRMLIASFVSVFPHTSLWFLGTEGVLIGTIDSLRIDIDSLKRRMSPVGPMGDFAKISLADPARLLSCFLMDERRVREYVDNAPVISDDFPRIEFSAPRNLVLPVCRLWLENMNELLLRRVAVPPYIVKAGDSAAAGIRRCQRASSFIMQAGILNAQWKFFQAFSAADSALALMPGDTTARMIRRETIDNILQRCLNDARVCRSQGNSSAAEGAYLRALAVDSFCAPANTELATLYNALGMFDKGLEYAQKAVRSSPGDPAMHTNLAVVYMNFNRPADAEAELLRAIAVSATYGRAFFFLGTLYKETGRSAEGRDALQKAEELGYKSR
jgi:spermidine synthase